MSRQRAIRRVVITGVGLVTPVGLTAPKVWQALQEGTNGIRLIPEFEEAGLKSRIGGSIVGFQGKDWIQVRKTLKMMPPAVQYGMAASRMAIEDSTLEISSVVSTRFGVATGTGSAGGELDAVIRGIDASVVDGAFDLVRFGEQGMHEINPLWLIRGLSNAAMGHASVAFQLKGYNTNICNSGASGLQALGDAARAIAIGRADVMLAGGYDAAVSPQVAVRFERLGLVTRQTNPQGASRPFDATRDGLVVADGAGFVLMEARADALARGARIYAEVVGVANASDGTAFLDPLPDGSGIARSMASAILDAELDADAIDVVFVHAPGTQPYDRAETHAIKTALGAHAGQIAAPAIKSMLGHSIAASGSISAAVAALAIDAQRVPPTINLKQADPACDLDYVTEGSREMTVNAVVINASGLGGTHASLVLRRHA